jgi:hypothetical protein
VWRMRDRGSTPTRCDRVKPAGHATPLWQPHTSNPSPQQRRWWRSGLRYPSVNQMVISGSRSNRPFTSGPLLPAGAVLGVFRQRQCKLVTQATSMPSPNTSLQRTPARVECIALRRPAAVGNALATSALGRTLGPLSSGRYAPCARAVTK